MAGAALGPTVGAVRPGTPSVSDRFVRFLPLLMAGAIAGGGAAHLAGAPRAGDVVWAAAIATLLVPLTASVARSLRAGDVGVDAIALLAMAGALALGELLAGAVVALMLSGGNALEAAASHRARRELTAPLARAPRIAHRRTAGEVEEVPVDARTSPAEPGAVAVSPGRVGAGRIRSIPRRRAGAQVKTVASRRRQQTGERSPTATSLARWTNQSSAARSRIEGCGAVASRQKERRRLVGAARLLKAEAAVAAAGDGWLLPMPLR